MVYTIGLMSVFLFAMLAKPIKRSQKDGFFAVLCYLLLGIMSAVRYQNEHSDFRVNYRKVILASKQTWSEAFHYSIEFLHQFIRKIIGNVFHDPQFYFIIVSLFVVGMTLFILKKYSCSLFLCVLLYYVEFGYFSLNNVTRQALAVALCMYSWKYLIDRKLPQYLLVMTAAFFTHISVIFFVPMYFISNLNFTKKNIIGYLTLGLTVVVFNGPIIRFMQRFLYSDYVETSYGMTPANKIRIVFAILCGIMILILTNRRHSFSEKYLQKYTGSAKRYQNFILNGAFIYVICTILSTLRMLLFSRIALYFAPCAILCIDNAIDRIPNKHTKRFVYVMVVLFCIAWFTAMNTRGKYIPTPYKTFWMFPERDLCP